MMTIRSVLTCAVVSASVLLAACSTPMQAMSSKVVFSGNLSASQEVPPNASTGSGTFKATFDTATRLLSWTIAYSGTTGPVTAGHFHGPALAGQNAGVALPLTGSLESPIQGTATLTPEQAADFMAGRWYLNLHTAANKGGEIRVQALLTPSL